MSDKKPENGLFRLNVVQTILAILISLGTGAVGFAAYITLPQKVTDLKSDQTHLWEHAKDTDSKRDADHEILVRMEEQLKAIQSDQSEMKADIKNLRRPAMPD